MAKDNKTDLLESSNLGTATATASAEASLDLYTRPEEDPPYLYRYTSPGGLIQIVQSCKMFATNIRYLNDFSEYIFTHDLFYGRLGQHIEDSDDPEVAAYLGHIRESVLDGNVDSASALDGNIYVVSFSANGDLLSQWRGYCPPDGGYSIGFSPADLRTAAEVKIGLFPGSWRLVKCEYDGEGQFRLIDNAILNGVEAFHHVESESSNAVSKHLRGEEKGVPPELADLKLDLNNAVGRLAPVLKHQAFAEEEEWRLVSTTIIDGDSSIQFREGDTSVVPFVFFDLPGSDR